MRQQRFREVLDKSEPLRYRIQSPTADGHMHVRRSGVLVKAGNPGKTGDFQHQLDRAYRVPNCFSNSLLSLNRIVTGSIKGAWLGRNHYVDNLSRFQLSSSRIKSKIGFLEGQTVLFCREQWAGSALVQVFAFPVDFGFGDVTA